MEMSLSSEAPSQVQLDNEEENAESNNKVFHHADRPEDYEKSNATAVAAAVPSSSRAIIGSDRTDSTSSSKTSPTIVLTTTTATVITTTNATCSSSGSSSRAQLPETSTTAASSSEPTTSTGLIGGSSGRVGNRPQTTRNEREDEILTASPSPSTNAASRRNEGGIGREGLIGDIGQIDDVTNVQPGSTVTRVYKKCASNGSLAVYVGTRTLMVGGTHLEPLKGVLVLDRDSLTQGVSSDFRIWGQITLTFRYGREDEEVLGLRFCNEAILALKQLWPPIPRDPEDPEDEDEELTPLQAVLLERIRSSASSESIQSVPFVLCAGPVGLGAFPPPPSVLLAPAKPYRGSPIGTIYDLRIYASERPEERPPRRNLIRLALRAVQMPCLNVPFDLKGAIEARPTILSRGKIRFSCELNKNAVRYGEPLEVKVVVQNNSRSSIRKVVVSLIQQVDVCMFTSGKFKNAVGCADDTVLIVPGASLQKRYILTPIRGPARQWLALEEAFGREPVLAPTTILDKLVGTEVVIPPPQSGKTRNVFAIIVSYYVKAKLVLGGLSLGQCVKVPFVLLPPENADPDPYPHVPGQASSTAEGVDGGGAIIAGGDGLNTTATTSQDLGAFPCLRITTAAVTPCATANASPVLSTSIAGGTVVGCSGDGKNSTKRLTSESSIITVSNTSETSNVPPSNVPTSSSNAHPEASTSGGGRALEPALCEKILSMKISGNTEGKVDS